jgi:hypothetical protein
LIEVELTAGAKWSLLLAGSCESGSGTKEAESRRLKADSWFFRVLLESGKRRCPGRKDPKRIPGVTAAGNRELAKEGRLVPFEPV